MTLMARGGWIAFGGALGVLVSPDAALFAGTMIFLFGWAENSYKERRKRRELREVSK